MRQDGMRDLTMQMQKRDGGIIPLQLRQAVVTAVTGDTLTVTLDGTSITSVRKIGSYYPLVNDVVWLFQNGADLLALGTAGVSGDTGWQEITDLRNGATATQTGITNGWAPRYRRVNGIVYLQGLINTNATTNPLHVATLPVGFRPRNILMEAVFTSGGIIRRMDIDSSGAITFREASGTIHTAWHSITATFPADA